MNFPPDEISQLVEALWHVSAGVPQSLVLGHCSFRSLVGTGSCMTELNLEGGAELETVEKKKQEDLQHNQPLKQTWWRRFQYTSTPRVW